MSRADRTDGELDWPAWAERTSPGDRERTHKFKVGMGQATKEIESELLDRVGADDWRFSTAAPHRKSDGLPYADANPDDPGVVVRWSKDGEQYAVAADQYTKIRDNVRAIGLYIEEKRKMANRPVKTGQDEFATARLPSGDEGDGAVVVEPDKEPHEVLEVSPDASDAIVKVAYRELMKVRHPDQGGSQQEFAELQWARDEMMGEGE